MLSEQEENLNTLMLLTNMSEEKAAELLDHRVRIVVSPAGCFPKLADDIARLLARTVRVVDASADCDLELAIGPAATTDQALCLALSDEAMILGAQGDIPSAATREQIAGITRRVCACFAAGFVLSQLVGDVLPYMIRPSFDLRFAHLDLPLDDPEQPLALDDVVLAGGGGVGNGFLWGLEELRPSGTLTIVDPKRARAGNSNRCLFFAPSDDGYKAELLAERVDLPNVATTSFVGTLHDYVATRPDKRLPILVSTADSRPVRRSFQAELPFRVFDASTTDVSEVVLHSHEQPNDQACLSCIYPHIADEDHRDRHIADSLGLTLAEVQARFISPAAAAELVERFPGLKVESLAGTAFDSLHKALCGEQALPPAPGAEQAAAPFAFVSNLAGVLLALEMLQSQTDRERWRASNYMALSPWQPPHARLRRQRPRLATCEFCSKPTAAASLRAVWCDRLE